MSGSNAIAAAKRRRGGTEINKPIQSQNRNISQSQNQTNSNVPPSQIHPLQLVMINHERLNKLSNDFSHLPQALDNLGENFNALSSNCDFLHEKLEGLETKLNNLNLNDSEGSTKSVNLELNNRLESIETRVNELFKQFSTLQSYMLELTLGLTNCKNNIGIMNSQIEEQEQKMVNMINTALCTNENIATQKQTIQGNTVYNEDIIVNRNNEDTQVNYIV